MDTHQKCVSTEFRFDRSFVKERHMQKTTPLLLTPPVDQRLLLEQGPKQFFRKGNLVTLAPSQAVICGAC